MNRTGNGAVGEGGEANESLAEEKYEVVIMVINDGRKERWVGRD